jgi:zinc D-Ala-D-Ala carboxypeptidase
MNYFENETACPCCGLDNPDPDLMRKLNYTREILNRPVKLTSVCRCEKHNADIGGVKNSAHLTSKEITGKAADIYCKNSDEKLDVVSAAIIAGFKRIIVYRTKYSLVHVDIDSTKPQGLIVET